MVYWDLAVAEQEWLEFQRDIIPTLNLHREKEGDMKTAPDVEIWGWQEPEASPAADYPVRTWEDRAAQATTSAAAAAATPKKRAAVAWATAKKKMMAKSILKLKLKLKLKSSPKDVASSETS
ncbi:hypothetical protein ACHAPO_004447 [Fusarium lateritium]